MGDEELSLANLIKIIEAGIDNINGFNTPRFRPGSDRFLRSFPDFRIKSCFVIGVEDGEMPARPKAEGLLDDLNELISRKWVWNWLQELGRKFLMSSFWCTRP